MQRGVTKAALPQWQVIWMWVATHLSCLPQVYDKDRMLHGVWLRSSISRLFTSLNIVGYDGFTCLYMSIYNTHKYHMHVYPVLVGCSQLDKPFLGLEFLNWRGLKRSSALYKWGQWGLVRDFFVLSPELAGWHWGLETNDSWVGRDQKSWNI